jgi:hypothetical protein
MQRYRDVVLNSRGEPVPSVSVLVLTYPAGDLAHLFSDDVGTVLANPVASDPNGAFSFKAANGHYSLVISGTGVTTQTINDITLSDSADAVAGAVVATKAELAAGSGAALVGHNGETVASELEALQLADYAALSAYVGNRKSVYVTGYLASATPSGIAGLFVRDDSDTTSIDNGGTVIVAANGKRFKRSITGDYSDGWFTTLQAAVTAAAGKKLRISGQWALTAQVNVESNTEIYFTASSLVTTATPNIALFYAGGKANVHFCGCGKLQQTVAGASAFIGAIVLDGSTDCTVTGRLEFVGFQWAGVYIVNSQRCKVNGGYFHDWLGAVDNSAGVIIYQDSNDNVVDGIHAKATGWMGVYVQDPGGSGTYNPQRNKIRNCRVENTTAYGVMLYINHAGNSYNEVTGCTISGVTGTAGAGQYGMGIYAVGGALGGCKILGNSITNCCINQTVATNGMGGITITGNAAGYVKPIVSENSVDGMTQGCGIDVLSMLGGVDIGPNTVYLPAANTGAGPGGAALRGQALRVFNCNDVAIAPGDYVNAGSSAAILLNATDANYDGITLNIGNARAVGPAVITQRTGAFTITGSIAGGTVKSSSDAGNAMQLLGFSGPISGVTLRTTGTGAATAALSVSNCANVRFSQMDVQSTGAYSVSIGASNTGNWDKNNRFTGRLENSSSGFKTEIYSAGIPTVGIFQISDRAVNTSVVVGTAKAWSRATAGSTHVLGTDWISEGNL